VARIPPRLRRLVTVQAKNRCEYCLSPAEQTGIPMTIDHVLKGDPDFLDFLHVSGRKPTTFCHSSASLADQIRISSSITIPTGSLCLTIKKPATGVPARMRV
jgi:hypothetical protein